MKYILVSIAFVSLSLSSCNRASEAGNSTNSVDIFNKEQVAGLCTHNSAQRKEAMQTLEKGLKTFRVDKKPAEAVTIITSAITKYPTAGAYFELGNAYATAKDYAKAIDCYNMAEQMGFTPVSKLFYNVACAYSLSEKNREASQYLEYAMEAGYINKNQLMKDPDLNNVRKYGFSSIFAEAMKGIENADNAVLETFWQAFATLNLPFNIDFTTEKTLNPEQLLQYHFEKYIPEMHERDKFSRGTGDNYFALGTITQNEKFRTVVYAQCADIELGSEVPAMYFMVSYDNNGTIIDKMLVCGHRNNHGTLQDVLY